MSVVLAPQAIEDLAAAVDYLKEHRPDAATRLVERAFDLFRSLDRREFEGPTQRLRDRSDRGMPPPEGGPCSAEAPVTTSSSVRCLRRSCCPAGQPGPRSPPMASIFATRRSEPRTDFDARWTRTLTRTLDAADQSVACPLDEAAGARRSSMATEARQPIATRLRRRRRG